MNIEAQVDALEGLSQLDSALQALEDELSRERTALEEKKDKLSELEQKHQAATASADEMDNVRGGLIQEARTMSVQMERSREKLARCRTEREVNAGQREIEELRRLYRDRELEIEKLAALSEQARSDIDATQAERDTLSGELGTTEGELSTRLAGLQKEADEKHVQRAVLSQDVPPVMFRRYEMIRKRRGNALAYTTDGKCSECNILIPPQMFQKMRRREDFEQCASCNRIIYFKPPPPEGEAEAEAPAEAASAEE